MKPIINHREEAERLLAEAETHNEKTIERAQLLVAKAQVHATLHLADIRRRVRPVRIDV